MILNVKEKKLRATSGAKLYFLGAEIVLTVISLFCISWEMYLCLSKYLSKPTVTNVHTESFEQLPLPVFTFCKVYKVEDCSTPWESMFDDQISDECWWEPDSLPSYLPERGYAWRSEHEAEPSNLLSKLVGWNESTNDWSIIWKSMSKNTKMFKPVNIPLSKDEVAICYSVNIATLKHHSTLGVTRNTLSSNVLTYIHADNQLFEPTRTNVRFDDINNLISQTYKVELRYNKQLPTKDYPCSEDLNSFDPCVADQALQSVLKEVNCTLLFMDLNGTTCSSITDGQKAMEVYWKSFWNVSMRSKHCRLPCRFYKVDIQLPRFDNLLKMFSMDALHAPDKNLQINFNIPSLVEVTETLYSYDMISFIAELGGWLGLILGISFPQIIGLATDVFHSTSNTISGHYKRMLKYISSFLKDLLYLFCLCCVVWQAITCFKKYANGPAGTMIYFSSSSTIEKPALTFCISKEICPIMKNSFNDKRDENCTYYTQLKNSYEESHQYFWSNGTALKEMLSFIQVSNKNVKNGWFTFWNESFDKKQTNLLFDKLTVPLVGNKLQFCYSMNLNSFKEFSVLRFAVKADVFFALHKAGQFNNKLYTNKKSALNILNFYNWKDGNPIHQDTTFNLKLIYNILGISNLATCQAYTTSYDQCIHDYAASVSKEKADCLLPNNIKVINDKHGKKLCNNASAEKAAVDTYVQSYLDQPVVDIHCRNPCNSIESILITKQEVKAEKDQPYLSQVDIIMPKMVKILESFNTYTFINLVSEFGSWLGIFLGVCLLDVNTYCFDSVIKLFTKKKGWKVYETIGEFVQTVFTLFCVSCVAWQLIVCFQKFIANPLATTIYHEKLSPSSLPQFTLCSVVSTSDLLKPYYEKNKASKRNTTALKLESILQDVKVLSSSQKEWKSVWNRVGNASSLFISPKVSDGAVYLCQQVDIPPGDYQQVQLSFKYSKNVNVFMHKRGYFFAEMTSSKIKLSLTSEKNIYVLKMKDTRLVPTKEFECHDSSDMSLDACLQEYGKEQMMQTVGCLAPVFHSNMTNFCPNFDQAKKALRVYFDNMTTNHIGQSRRCSSPCHTLQVVSSMYKTLKETSTIVHTFVLPALVEVTQAFYYYSFFNFVAELGGWVGLFLGVYVLQINTWLHHWGTSLSKEK